MREIRSTLNKIFAVKNHRTLYTDKHPLPPNYINIWCKLTFDCNIDKVNINFMLFVGIISVQLNLLTMTTLGDRKVGVVEWYMGQFADYGKYTQEIYQDN